MEITIQITCESIGELQQHLSVMKQQVRSLMKREKLTPDDEFNIGAVISDNNCYGIHDLNVI